MEMIPPQQQIARMLTGYWISQAIYVAAKLGLADLVKDGPKSADDLAKTTGTHAPSLYRLLRALASVGVFAEDDCHRFGMTPLAECLLDVPGSQRYLAIMACEEQFRAWGELLYSVQTGKTGFDKVFGMPIFDFLAQHPEQANAFDLAMVGVHGRESAAVLDAYDFSGFRVLADIGGGNGSVITGVLGKYPALRGILFDLPGVTERATDNIKAAGLADRCQVIGGNFFKAAPQGADAYMMRHIIHDWDDEKATTILQNIHRVMPKDGKLLVIEGVIQPGNDPSFGKLLDLAMLVNPGGKERTEEEYRTLFKMAGFDLVRIVRTAVEISVIEGRKM